MIHLEWFVNYPQRDSPPRNMRGGFANRDLKLELGITSVDNYLDLTLGEVFWPWAEALMVRTADGTWTMSWRSFCWWHEGVIILDRDRLRCPEGPTPRFPDSWYYDYDLYPPNHTRYYQDGRHAAINPSHYESGTPRLADQYWGIPPS